MLAPSRGSGRRLAIVRCGGSTTRCCRIQSVAGCCERSPASTPPPCRQSASVRELSPSARACLSRLHAPFCGAGSYEPCRMAASVESILPTASSTGSPLTSVRQSRESHGRAPPRSQGALQHADLVNLSASPLILRAAGAWPLHLSETMLSSDVFCLWLSSPRVSVSPSAG
jgi:hypothetical protein